MGLKHWGESDDAADFKITLEEAVSKLVKKELRHFANEYNTSGAVNIALMLEDGIISIKLIEAPLIKVLLEQLNRLLEDRLDSEHRRAYKRLIKFVTLEMEKLDE